MSNSAPPESRSLYVMTSPLFQARAKLVAAHVLEEQRAGRKPVLAVCYAKKGACDANVWGLRATCQRCNKFVDRLEEQTGLALSRIDASAITGQAPLPTKVAALIQRAISSTLMSATRLTEPLFDWSPGLKRRAGRLRVTAVGLYFGLRDLIKSTEPEHVWFFNGRTVAACAAKAAAIDSELPYTALEFSGNGAMQSFPQTSPHDRAFRQKKMFEEPNIAGAEVFDRLKTTDGNIFLRSADTKTGGLTASPYVVIFESSNDEVAALTDWKRHVELIDCVASLVTNTDLDIVVRWHPNQATSGTNTVLMDSRAVLALSRRVHVVTPWMEENSYQLIEGATAVFAYGSTIGVEAAWMGIPTFLLGDAWYDSLSFVHVVTDASEIPDCLSWPTPDPEQARLDCRRYMGHMRDWGYSLACAEPVVRKASNDPAARVDYKLDVAPKLRAHGASARERRYRIARQALDFLHTRWMGLPEGLKRSFPHGELIQKPFVVKDGEIRFV